ncbi:DNA polymerase III subunit chi [Pseudomonas aeruginosa]
MEARLRSPASQATKAWRRASQVYLHCAEGTEQRRLDESLCGAFSGEPSFLADLAEDDAEARVAPGSWERCTGNHRDLLINLPSRPPASSQISRGGRTVWSRRPPIRQAARDKFRFYREQGYPLRTIAYRVS